MWSAKDAKELNELYGSVFAREGMEAAVLAVACTCGVALGCAAERHPCSPTCTHDDAAKPGHPERVKEMSEAVNEQMARAIADHNRHVDSMGGPVAEAEEEGDDGPWVVQSGEEQASEAYDEGAEAMRAAVEKWAKDYFGSVPPTLKDAMDGAAP